MLSPGRLERLLGMSRHVIPFAPIDITILTRSIHFGVERENEKEKERREEGNVSVIVR